MKKRLLLLLATLSLVACKDETDADLRADRLAHSKGDILVAVPWPLKSSKATLLQGVDLAVDEINNGGGILGGRKIKILPRDDEASLNAGHLVAQEIADNPDVAAVIGHLNTYVALPAAQIYQRAGLVMLTPGASGQRLTEQGNKLVFRVLPGNREQGNQIAEYAAAQGYKSVAIYYIKNDYGVDLANYFERRARELGIVVADRRSYDKDADDYAGVMNDWASYLKFDAVFLVGSLPESPKIVRAMRAAGIKVPVFGGAGLDSPDLIKLGGDSVDGTVVFSLFNSVDSAPNVVAFCNHFKRRYGVSPDSTAAEGYDAIRLLAKAMETAHSAVPSQVAKALHGAKDWSGVTGSFTFDAAGDPERKALAKVVVTNGRFTPITEARPQA